MADTTSTDTPGGESPTPPPAEPATGSDQASATTSDSLGEAGLKALKTEREARRAAERELAALRKQSAATAADLDAAKAQLGEYEHRDQVAAWRAQVSKETGVPADVLRGDTLEDLQAHGEALAPLLRARGPVVPDAGTQPEGSAATASQEFVRKLFGSE